MTEYPSLLQKVPEGAVLVPVSDEHITPRRSRALVEAVYRNPDPHKLISTAVTLGRETLYEDTPNIPRKRVVIPLGLLANQARARTFDYNPQEEMLPWLGVTLVLGKQDVGRNRSDVIGLAGNAAWNRLPLVCAETEPVLWALHDINDQQMRITEEYFSGQPTPDRLEELALEHRILARQRSRLVEASAPEELMAAVMDVYKSKMLRMPDASEPDVS